MGRRVDRPGRGRPALRRWRRRRRRTAPTDPYPQVISVRQRRDYRVPSVVGAAAGGRGRPPQLGARTTRRPARSSRSARPCWSCCRPATARCPRWTCRSWSRSTACSRSARSPSRSTWRRSRTTDGAGPFAPPTDDQLVGRLDEHPFLPDEEDDHAGHNHSRHDHAALSAHRPRRSPLGGQAPSLDGRLSTTGRAAGWPGPAAEHHLPGAVPEELDPGQLPSRRIPPGSPAAPPRSTDRHSKATAAARIRSPCVLICPGARHAPVPAALVRPSPFGVADRHRRHVVERVGDLAPAASAPRSAARPATARPCARPGSARPPRAGPGSRPAPPPAATRPARRPRSTTASTMLELRGSR